MNFNASVPDAYLRSFLGFPVMASRVLGRMAKVSFIKSYWIVPVAVHYTISMKSWFSLPISTSTSLPLPASQELLDPRYKGGLEQKKTELGKDCFFSLEPGLEGARLTSFFVEIKGPVSETDHPSCASLPPAAN